MSTPLAPTLEAFFTDRLLCQKRVSSNTIASYRDTFRLLLRFVHERTGTRPAQLELTQLAASITSKQVLENVLSSIEVPSAATNTAT